MTLTGVTVETADAPAWARPEIFPSAPDSGWGWMSTRGRFFPCARFSDLENCVREGSRIALVWTPRHPQLVVPEEVPELFAALHDARMRWAMDDIATGKHRMRTFAIMALLIALVSAGQGLHLADQVAHKLGTTATTFDHARFALDSVRHSTSLGIILLLGLIFGFIPWYRGWKRQRDWRDESPAELTQLVTPLRFETWLDLQRAPITWWFAALMAIVGLAQLLYPGSAEHAGLVRAAYNHGHGETWRLFTSPFLHGNLLHWFMNTAALLYLGRRMEVLARWPHLPLVFAMAAIVGGEFSVRWMQTNNSLGASGGLMGWLGFLLVFETLHPKLAPLSARRRLLGGLALTALIGLLGYKYIDNAAHAGGMLAGMIYAAIVFPKSSSPHRPRGHWADYAAGSLALIACVAAAMFTIWKVI